MARQNLLSQDDIQKLLNIGETSDDDLDYQPIEVEISNEDDIHIKSIAWFGSKSGTAPYWAIPKYEQKCKEW